MLAACNMSDGPTHNATLNDVLICLCRSFRFDEAFSITQNSFIKRTHTIESIYIGSVWKKNRLCPFPQYAKNNLFMKIIWSHNQVRDHVLRANKMHAHAYHFNTYYYYYLIAEGKMHAIIFQTMKHHIQWNTSCINKSRTKHHFLVTTTTTKLIIISILCESHSTQMNSTNNIDAIVI